MRTEALPLMAEANYLGLGEEARRLLAWAQQHDGSARALRLDGQSLRDSAGSQIRLSPQMAVALERLDRWYALLPPTRAHPVTHEELRAASLAKGAVARVRDLFERSIRRGVWVKGTWVVPETGGETSIDKELRLWEAPAPEWEIARDLLRRGNDPHAIAALYNKSPAEMALLDPAGLLKSAIIRFRNGDPNGPADVARSTVTLAQNAAERYSISPETQFTLIVQTRWRGRYVGRWHTHAPHDTGSGWRSGEAPSFDDMQNAVRDSQFLTVSFDPDGFDLYDAAALATVGTADLSQVKVIRYRSRSWREHFRALHASLSVVTLLTPRCQQPRRSFRTWAAPTAP